MSKTMNVIFLTMSRITGVSNRGIYTDLLRKFRDDGHDVFVVTPHERSFGMPTEIVQQDGVHILGVRTLNLQKTNVVEKGVGQVLVDFPNIIAPNVFYFDKDEVMM